jgi:hypothetical protein
MWRRCRFHCLCALDANDRPRTPTVSEYLTDVAKVSDEQLRAWLEEAKAPIGQMVMGRIGDLRGFATSAPEGRVGALDLRLRPITRGVDDIHFHPAEPRQVRLSATYRF